MHIHSYSKQRKQNNVPVLVYFQMSAIMCVRVPIPIVILITTLLGIGQNAQNTPPTSENSTEM